MFESAAARPGTRLRDSSGRPALIRSHAALLRRVADGDRPARSQHALDAPTEREVDVLRLAAEGLGDEDIGPRLFLSPLTAKTHVSRILTKVGARDRVQLVVLA
ncbi:MAG: response regulator transcription factor [Naasia sp.]|nr:response regulator transcription factor [Naasia sp.]